MSDEVDFVGFAPVQVAEAACRAFSIFRAVELMEQGTKIENVLEMAEAIYKYIMPDGWDKEKSKTRNRIQVVKSDGN